MLGHRVIRSAPFPVPDKSGQALNRLTVKAQRLTYLTRSRASAIGDDVGCHRRAQCPILLIDVLDHLFAMVAGREIQIDVWPFTAILA